MIGLPAVAGPSIREQLTQVQNTLLRTVIMAYHPLKKFKRRELKDELGMLLAEHLNAVVRGDLSSHDAREAFFQAIDGRFGKRAKLKQLKAFQRELLFRLMGGVPKPSEDDLGMVLGYLRQRILKGSLSLPEAKERLARAVRLLDSGRQSQWMNELEGDLLGRAEPASLPAMAHGRPFRRRAHKTPQTQESEA